MQTKYCIDIPQLNLSLETPGRLTLLELLRHKHVFIATSCSGEARCGLCVVSVLSGRDKLHSPTIDEKELLEKKDFDRGIRLACQIWVECDLTISTDYW